MGDLGDPTRRYEGIPETEEPLVLPKIEPDPPVQVPEPVPTEPERVQVG